MTGRTMIATAALLLAGGCATMQQTQLQDPMERVDAIAGKIRAAETLGAKDCSPRDLAKAQVAMEHVRHEVDEGFYAQGWMEPDLIAAERTADELLIARQLAARLGGHFRCVSGKPRMRPDPGNGG